MHFSRKCILELILDSNKRSVYNDFSIVRFEILSPCNQCRFCFFIGGCSQEEVVIGANLNIQWIFYLIIELYSQISTDVFQVKHLISKKLDHIRLQTRIRHEFIFFNCVVNTIILRRSYMIVVYCFLSWLLFWKWSRIIKPSTATSSNRTINITKRFLVYQYQMKSVKDAR